MTVAVGDTVTDGETLGLEVGLSDGVALGESVGVESTAKALLAVTSKLSATALAAISRCVARGMRCPSPKKSIGRARINAGDRVEFSRSNAQIGSTEPTLWKTAHTPHGCRWVQLGCGL